MSVWHDITDVEDLSFSEDFSELHILFETDNYGNNYAAVPMELLVRFLASDHEQERVRVRVSVEDRLVASFRQSGKHEPAAFILNISKREKPTCPSCMTTMHASSSDPLSLKWKCEDCEYSYPVVLPPAPDLEKK